MKSILKINLINQRTGNRIKSIKKVSVGKSILKKLNKKYRRVGVNE